jgi:beta-lactamase class A
VQAAQPASARKGAPALAAAVALVAVLALGGTLYAQANTAAQTDAAAANAAAPTAITQQRVTDSTTTQTSSEQATLAAFNAEGVTSNTSTQATLSATDAASEAATGASDTFVTSITPQLTALLSAYGAGVACVIQPLDSAQPAFSYNASAQFASSGLTALAVQAAYIDAVTCGNLDPTDTYTVRAADIVGGTGTLKQRGAGTTLTYAQLAQLMVAENDNTATNILIDTLGLPAVNAACQAAGAAQTSVNRKLMQLDTGAENYTTAANTATLLCAVGNKTAGSADVCQAALDALAAQTDNKALAAGVSTGSGAALAHKTATMGGLRHDAGILYVAQNAQNAEGVTSASAAAESSAGTDGATSNNAASDTFDNTTQTRAYAVVVLCNIGQTTANNLMKDIATLLTA